MESERNDIETPDREAIAAALREDERAAAAPWVEGPPSPAWYPAACGAWFGAWAWILTSDHWWSSLLLAPLLLLVVLHVRWERRRRGTSPRWRGAPGDLTRVLWLSLALTAVVGVLGLAIDHVAGRWPMIAWVTVGAAACVALDERLRARAARRVRERLG